MVCASVRTWTRRVFKRSRREEEHAMVKFTYIGNTRDIEKFEAITGKIEDALNWEATRLGMHVEVELTPKQILRLRDLGSVTVFDEKQHVLTDDDMRLHNTLGWSKAGMARLKSE